MRDSNSTQKMFVKSYFDFSIEDATERAVAELGPDVLLLDTRDAPAEARHLGPYEIVFGVRLTARPGSAPAPAQDQDQVGELRQQVAEIRNLITRLAPESACRTGARPLIEEALTAAGIGREVAS